jgi:hypothetical protein
MSIAVRPELPPMPDRIAALPRDHRGYPVPWFVEWIIDGHAAPIGEGAPDFRVMSSERLADALRYRRCWICGGRLGAHQTFVIGPMCAVNRTSAEPPSHQECGSWSARACPFLTRPHARRREAGLPEELAQPPGVMLRRNPGVALVWTSRRWHPRRLPDGGLLFDIGEPDSVRWYAEGRDATREEVLASIESGLPALEELAGDRLLDRMALERCVNRAMELLPA